MYLRMLKKDLKRNKTANIILLLFIIIPTTFVASSVNNIITVTSAIDYFFEKADVPDYITVTKGGENDKSLEDSLNKMSEIDGYKKQDIIYAAPANVIIDATTDETLNSTTLIMSCEDAGIMYFDSTDARIEKVEEGTVIVTEKILRNNNLSVGDTIEIHLENTVLSLKVACGCKDAIFGSDMIGFASIILNEKDFSKFQENEEIAELYGGSLFYIDSDNLDAVTGMLSKQNGIIFSSDSNMLETTYIMNMIVAGILLVVSLGLVLLAFVVLRFAITFSLNQEFREIGIMKAIGFRDIKICSMYMAKYFVIVVAGSVIGFFASIAFSKLLLQSVSSVMVMGNDNQLITNLICCIIVVIMVLTFCFNCMRKVKNFTPIVAIRNENVDKYAGKKSVIKLNETRIRPSLFFAVNDIFRNPKRFVSYIFKYIPCLLIVLILVNTTNTLKSENMLELAGMLQADAYLKIRNEDSMSYLSANGKENIKESMIEIEEILAEHGIPAKCNVEVSFSYNFSNNKDDYKIVSFQGIGTTADMYQYTVGTAPQNANEIAITPAISEKLNVDIGDSVTVQHSTGERDYVITAFYQSMQSMGESVRFHESAETDFGLVSGVYAFQINYTDCPNEETKFERMEVIKEIYGADNVSTNKQYVQTIFGMGSILEGVKTLTLYVVMVIVALITILVQRSFITTEHSEIAILKSLGFRTGTIVGWQTMRIVILGIIATVIAVAINVPMTEFLVTPIFKMMGAPYGVDYSVKYFEVIVIYPLIVFSVSIICVFLTSLCTRTINTIQDLDIE